MTTTTLRCPDCDEPLAYEPATSEGGVQQYPDRPIPACWRCPECGVAQDAHEQE